MQTSSHRSAAEFVLDHLVWFLLVAVLVIFSIAIPNFAQAGIYANIIEASSVLGVLSIGLSLVIIAGHMDLSIESVAALGAMAVGVLFCSSGIGMGVQLTPGWLVLPVSILISILVGVVIGLLNGLLIVRLKMNAFIVTLASFIWVRGLVVAMSGGRSAQNLDPWLRFLGMPLKTFAPGLAEVPVLSWLLELPLIAWIAIAFFVVFSFIMARTPFGRHLTMIGGNPTATYRAGIKVDRLMLWTFVLAGAISGFAGWMLAIRTSGATANLGTGMLFNAFAAVVIGGVSLKGGVGRLSGVYAGVLLLSSIHTAINLMGLPAHYTQVILGALVLAAVLLDTIKHSLRQRFT